MQEKHGRGVMSAVHDEERIEFALATETRARLGESPVWDAGRGCLWWVDVEGRSLLKTGAHTGDTTAWPTPEMPGFVVLTSAGVPALGMETGIFVFFESDARFERIVELGKPNVRFNDATVDASGRLWACTMDMANRAPAGVLYSVSADRRLVAHLGGIRTPNGLAHDPARNRLYLSDSHPDVQAVWMFDCDIVEGRLSGRGVFAAFEKLKGRPDGAALDSEGRYWIAGVDGGVLHVFEAGGAHAAEHRTPFRSPTKPAFGGPDLACLYVTSKAGSPPGGAIASAALKEMRGCPPNAWRIQ